MPKQKIVTPEVILQKFYKQLNKKKGELEYLVCMNRQFEKWLQYELALSVSDIALPVVYDSNYNEISYQYADGSWEQICDISAEYPIIDMSSEVRTDICIAEKPFISRYTDKKTWKIKDDEARLKCENEYNQAKYHYIELKQLKWLGIKDPDIVSIVLTNDLKKYRDIDWKTFKSYKPCSIISLCLVPFWNPAKPSKKCSALSIRKAVKKIRSQSITECDEYFGIHGTFSSKYITREICLMMLSYKL